MAIIVIRLHPDKRKSGDDFQKDLEGLEIQVNERSFGDPKAVQPVSLLGTAKYIAEGDPAATIIQHRISGLRAPIATAAIEVADPPFPKEYKSLDLRLTVTRSGLTIVNHDVNFNVDLSPGPMPPSTYADYMQLASPLTSPPGPPVSLYLPIPPASTGLGGSASTAYVDVQTDGTAPSFDAVVIAVGTVLSKDPGGGVDLAALTPGQCQHVAREIINNRELDPYPNVPAVIGWLEGIYDPASGDDGEKARQKFEADLLTYYTVHQTRADVLSKFIYSMSAALACAKKSQDATQVGFTFPILPGKTPSGQKIAEATVVISQ